MRTKSSEPMIASYLHSKGKKLGLPIAGNFELTARCNFHCPMCYVHMSEQQVQAAGGELTAEQWLDLARQARDQGMVFALLTGGEPLVRKDFFRIYDGMRNMGLSLSVNSNGALLRGEVLERFLEAPPIRFNISLYGGCEETYRNMCGQSVYRQVKENIRRLREAGVDVGLNLSITPYNCQDLEQIYADALALDVNVRASAYMYPPVRLGGEYGQGNRLTPAQAAQYTVAWDRLRLSPEEFARRAERFSRLIRPEPEGCPAEQGEGIGCRAGSTSFWITWQGKMLPCGMLTAPAVYPLEEGFASAWETLRQETARIRLPAECTDCSHREVCGVCAAVCSCETGRFDGVPHYLCQKAREQVRLTRLALEERSKP